MNPTQAESATGVPGASPVPLESVLCTEELTRRPTRAPDYETDNRALVALAQALADSPRTILQTLADTILEVFQCDSAGISLLTTHDGGKRFHWPAIAGVWKPHIGGGTPRDFGPCGDVLDRNAPLLFRHFERRYTYFLPVAPPVEECLLVPFYVEGKAIGTIWAIAHNDRRKFDAEDLRQLVSLGSFASSAYQAVASLNALEQRGEALRQSHAELAQRLAELQTGNAAGQDSRRAALNLMEDAVQARQAMETLNVELRESEERYRTLFELGPVAVYSCDTSGVIQNFNRRAAELWDREPAFGDTDERFCGSFKLFRPDGSFMPHEQSPMAGVLSGNLSEVRDAEVLIERPGGSRVTVVVNIRPLKNQRGELTGAINCFYDITERKRQEALLACQKETFEKAAVGAPLLEVLEFLLRGAETQSSQPALVAIHLLDESGERFEQTAAPSLPPGYRQAVNGMAVSSASGSCCAAVASRKRVVVPDIAASQEYPAFATFALPLGLRAAWSTPIFSLAGKVMGSFVTYYREPREPGPQDVLLGEIVTRTAAVVIEHQRAQEESHRHAAQFETLLNEVPLGVYLVDADFRIRHVSPTTFRVFGDIPDLIGRDFDEVIHILWPQAYADEIVRRFRHTLETGEHYVTLERIEERLDRGVTEIYEWQISRIPLPGGRYGVVCYFRDISAQVRARAAMAESDRRKNEFLAMLAHELRNPLAPISNALQILRDAASREQGRRRQDETVQSAYEMMGRQIGQMVRLVDDLLDVSRVSRGTIELRRGRVELVAVVDNAVEAARPQFECMNHKLTVSLPPEPIHLNADPARLAQVVGNLLNNACKFTEKGGRIELTVEREGEQAVIRVRDSGIGIAAGELPRIFDLFMQSDTSLERSASGLGLGLTLVKNLVELHGGTVGAHSAGAGQGSEFVVRLPIVAEPAEAPPPEPAAKTAPTTPRRILIVDDNQDSAASLAILLKIAGHETHTAHDGLEAVAAAEQFRPDVVLLDIGLPKLNGHAVCRRIREQPWGRKVVLIAVTGWGQDEDRQKSREAGFNAHLVKPVDYAALAKLLDSLPPERGGG